MNQIKLFIFLLSFIPMISSASVQEQTSTSSKIGSQLRMKTFSDWALPGPALEGFTPTPSALKHQPTGTFNYVWIDYPLFEDYRVVYWQSFLTNFRTVSFGKLDFFNPRFALRRDNFFSSTSNVSSRMDVFYQPGWTSLSGDTVQFQLGLRSENFYRPVGSSFSFGMIAETKWNQHTASANGKDPNALSLDLFPEANYDLTPVTSWHTGFGIFSQLKRDSGKMVWGLYQPHIQNGFTFNVSRTVWMAALVNNYLQVPPTLKNTWGSIWLSLNIL